MPTYWLLLVIKSRLVINLKSSLAHSCAISTQADGRHKNENKSHDQALAGKQEASINIVN